MSYTATLKVEMKNEEVIQKMVDRCGWKDCQRNGNRISFKVGEFYESEVRVDLDTGQVQVTRDSLNRQKLDEAIVNNDCRVQGDFENRISEELGMRYEEAAVVLGAEKSGRPWSEGVTSEGIPWIFVEEPFGRESSLEDLLAS